MSVRRAIAEVDVTTVNVSRFCEAHGIGRDAFYAWRHRFEAEGLAGLESRSRAPKRVANRTSAQLEDLIVAIRKELVDAGLDAGPETIHYWLRGRVAVGTAVPSASTIWRVLSRRGFVAPEPRKAPHRPHYRSFAADRANECWQMDSTHWMLADDTHVEIINVIDDCSRLAVQSLAVPSCTIATTWDALGAAAERYGWPERLLTDNGAAFGVQLTENLAPLGIGIGHSKPYHPQTCGKVERFHQTTKKWLVAHDPAPTLAVLQQLLDEFIGYYNEQRPHRSLHRRTPRDVWGTTAHSGPADQPLGLTTVVHRNLVYDGVVWAGRFRITIGVAHNSQRATIITTGDRCHVFIAGRLVRELTLDRTRPDQRLYQRPGNPHN